MKIQLDSPSSRLLQKHGVSRNVLETTRIYVFNFQFGAAITLPFLFVGPVVLIKRKWLVYDENNDLQDSGSIQMLCHELCHARQIVDWGTLKYLARHLLARVKTRNLYAKSAIEESECYAVQCKVAEHYRQSSTGERTGA